MTQMPQCNRQGTPWTGYQSFSEPQPDKNSYLQSTTDAISLERTMQTPHRETSASHWI